MKAETYAVHAYAIQNNVRPRDLVGCFGVGASQVRLTKSQLVMEIAQGAWAVVYDFGAFVFVNVDERLRDDAMGKILAKVGPEPHAPLREEYAIEVAPDEPPSVTFDRVRVPEVTLPVVDLATLVVGQSVGMEYYEDDVDVTLQNLTGRAAMLAETGGFRGSIRELLRFVGESMVKRNRVVHTLSLLDAPPIVWESEMLDRLYRALRFSFEIEDRYRALDHKLEMIRDNLALLVDLAQARRSTQLEVGIIVLIAIEVVLFVYQMVTTGGAH
jgi:uncharacterized Rmd1/YagE family protein